MENLKYSCILFHLVVYYALYIILNMFLLRYLHFFVGVVLQTHRVAGASEDNWLMMESELLLLWVGITGLHLELLVSSHMIPPTHP